MGVGKSKHGKQKATYRKKRTEDASISIGIGTPPESPTSESISPPLEHIVKHTYSPPNRSNHVTFQKSSHSSVTTSHDGESVVFRELSKKIVRGRTCQPPSNKSVNCGSIRFSVARSVGPELPMSENSDTKSRVLLDLEGRKPIKINKYNYICSWLDQAAEVRSQRNNSEDRPSEVDLKWGLRREQDSSEFRGHKKHSRSHVNFVRTRDSQVSIDVEPYSTRSDISLTPPRSHKRKRNFQIDTRIPEEQQSRRYRPPERADYRRERRKKDTSRRRRSRRDRKASLETDQEVRRKILRDMERRREDAILTEVPRRRRREIEGRSDRRSSRRSKKTRKEHKRSEYKSPSRGHVRRYEEDYGEDFDSNINKRNQSRRSSRTHIRDNDTHRVYTAIIETHKASTGSPEENVENEPGAHSHGDCPGDLQPNPAPHLAAGPDLSTLRNFDLFVIQKPSKSSPDLIPKQKEEFDDIRSRLNLHRVDNELDLLSPHNCLKRSNPHTSLVEESGDVTSRSDNNTHIGGNLESDVPKSRTLSPEPSNQAPFTAEGDTTATPDLSSCISTKKDSLKTASAIKKLAKDEIKRKKNHKKPKRINNFLPKSRVIEESIPSISNNQRKDQIFVEQKKRINDGNVKHKTAAPTEKVHKKFSDFSHHSAEDEEDSESESESEDYYSEEKEGSAPVGGASKSMGDHWYPSEDDFEEGDPIDIPYNYEYSGSGYEQPYPYPRPSPTSPPVSGNKEESNGPQISTCGVGGICFKLPGRVTHKTTIKVAHFPRSDPICVNLPSVPQPPPCYPYCCPPPCLPPSCCPHPPDPQKQLNNCNVYNYSGKGQPLSL